MEKFTEKVLVVDDEIEILKVICDHLTISGFEVISATRSVDGLRLLQEHNVFLILSDYKMPEMDGLEFCREVRQVRRGLPFIILSGFADRTAVIAGVRHGVTDFSDKPLDFSKLDEMMLSYALKRKEQIKRELQELEVIRQTFLEEARSILGSLDESILSIERDPNDKAEIDRIFRKIHTLKGSGASVTGGQTLSDLAHGFENVLTAMKNDQVLVDKAIVDLMLKSSDALTQCIDAFEQNSPSPDVKGLTCQFKAILSESSRLPVPSPKAAIKFEKKDEIDEGVTVSNEKLDQFMELAGDLVALKNIFSGFVKERLSVEDGLADMSKALSKHTDDLQTKIMDIRKVSLQKAFGKFPRMVRSIAQDLKKEVNFETEGLELQVDKTIAKSLSACLVHVVRNACDHGLESIESRLSKGKSQAGNLRIVASQTDDMIQVLVKDDGAGLDRDRIYSKAHAKGLVTHDINSMSDQEIFELLFIPGFSTAEVVSDLSGRGVGMDVVKTAVTSLGGTARFESAKDQGTTLTIQVPVPQSIMVEEAIVVVSSDLLIAIPLSCIGDIKLLKNQHLNYVEPFWVLGHHTQFIPVATYDEFIQPESVNCQKIDIKPHELAVVISYKDQSIALRVDQIKDQLEAVVRPFDRITQAVPGFKGTCQLPGDQLAYMVSSEDFLRSIQLEAA